MAMRVFIGIDPGLAGALAMVSVDEAFVFDAPAVAVRRGNDYLVGGMVELINEARDMADGGEVYAALEAGIAMPRQSSSATAKTARGGGLWEGMLAMAGVRYELVPPNVWKRSMGVTSDKGEARVIAQRLFPALCGQLGRVKDHGRAEALLLAEWARRRAA